MTRPTDPAGMLRALQDLRIGFEIVTERIAKASRLNARDLSVLDVLHAEGASTPKRLADRIGIHPATLTTVLTRLERDGRVHRYDNPTDARSSLIAIDDQTVTELAQLFVDVDEEVTRCFNTHSKAERTVIIEFLADLTAAVRNAAP